MGYKSASSPSLRHVKIEGSDSDSEKLEMLQDEKKIPKTDKKNEKTKGR